MNTGVKIFWAILLLPVTILFMVGFTLVYLLSWVAGIPVTLRKRGRVVGHIRWFKYTKFN